MTTRNTIIAAVLALGLFVAAGSAFARQGYGPGSNYGNCPAFNNQATQALTPEKQKAYDAIVNDYNAKTETLRTDMWAARLELNALSGNANADPKRISDLIGTMKNLRLQMDAARDEFDARVQKEIGIAPNTRIGMGYGRGGRGYGHGYGHRSGYGPGSGGCPAWQ